MHSQNRLYIFLGFAILSFLSSISLLLGSKSRRIFEIQQYESIEQLYYHHEEGISGRGKTDVPPVVEEMRSNRINHINENNDIATEGGTTRNSNDEDDDDEDEEKGQTIIEKSEVESASSSSSCALCFFGLPRSFKSIVLPSIERNILRPNSKYNCDVFVHFFDKKSESGGRYNVGGSIDPFEIFLLEQSVHNVSSSSMILNQNTTTTTSTPPPFRRTPVVQFVNDTDESFLRKRQHLVEKFQTKMNKDGHPVYFPWKTNWQNSSLTNVVKQWHSIDASFSLMEAYSKSSGIVYDRVAMLRSDVMYLTAIDIRQLDGQDNKFDDNNTHFVIPYFSAYPVNDRMVYGPYGAVKIWAKERFRLIEERASNALDPGYEMHSERFLNASVFPAMVKSGYQMYINRDICFLRSRANSVVCLNDCAKGKVARGFRKRDRQRLIEQKMITEILGRNCSGIEKLENDNNTYFRC